MNGLPGAGGASLKSVSKRERRKFGGTKSRAAPCKVLPGPFLRSSYWMLIGITNERVTTALEGAGSVPVAKMVTVCGPAGTGVK
jgi:hypothetical protein